MKKFIGFFSLALSFGALASTTDIKSFVYDGSANSLELILRTEKTHTEYRSENRPSTCFRRGVVDHNTICSGGYYPGPIGPGYRGPYNPHRGPGYYPPGVPTHCYNEPIYGNVPYSCMELVKVPFEVKDYDVEARVIVDVTNVSGASTKGEQINVHLSGETFSSTASGSKKFFIVRKKQEQRESMVRNIKMIDGLVAVELVEAAPILKAIKMTNIVIEGESLKFKIGDAASLDNLDFSLVIKKNKFLGSNTILDRKLLPHEVEVSHSQSDSVVSVDLNQLGVQLEDGKFEITSKVEVKVDGDFMNSSQFANESSASRKLIYKVR